MTGRLGSKMQETADTTIILRLPRTMKEWLKDRAVSNDRNMTAELRHMIKASMETGAGQGGAK
jgi:hypothetical protein